MIYKGKIICFICFAYSVEIPLKDIISYQPINNDRVSISLNTPEFTPYPVTLLGNMFNSGISPIECSGTITSNPESKLVIDEIVRVKFEELVKENKM